MKRITQYQCDFCMEKYDNPVSAINYEYKHLGLTRQEYDEYKKFQKLHNIPENVDIRI